MQTAVTFIVLTAALFFSLVPALAIEQLIFASIVRSFLTPRSHRFQQDHAPWTTWG